MTAMTVRPLAGPGVVARAGDLLLVCTDGDSTVSALLGALNEVARAGGDGVALVRRVAGLLSMVDLSQTQGAEACAAAGPTRDGGYAVLVSGSALAEVATAAGDVTVSGAGSLTAVTRLVPDPTGWVRLQLPGAGTAHPRSRLDGGVVAGNMRATAILLGLHEDWDLDQCLQTAVCAAAASLSHPTCTGGMRSLSACLALGKKFGFRTA